MNVLLLSQFYWPEVRTAPTNLATIAEDLQRSGHRVTVITGFPNHPFGKVYAGYRQRLRQWEDVRDVQVLRVPLYADHSLSAARRFLHYGSFALSAATIGAWTTRKLDIDVILVYLPPWTNWLPIRALEALHGAPLVYLVTDLWPEAFGSIGRRLKPWQHRLLDRLVRATTRRAATICVNSPGYKPLLAQRGVPEEDLEIVYDFVDETVFYPAEREAELAREYGMNEKFNVIYGGNLGAAQGLDTLLRAAQRLRDVDDLQLVFIGDGTDEALLKQQAEERRLANVRFVDRQPMSEMHRFFALADCLILHLVPSPLYRLQLPSKTIAYLACGKPIVCGVAGSAAGVVEEAGAGLCCEPGDAEGMARTVRQMYELPHERRAQLGENGRVAFLRKYSRREQTAKIERALERAVWEAAS